MGLASSMHLVAGERKKTEGLYADHQLLESGTLSCISSVALLWASLRLRAFRGTFRLGHDARRSSWFKYRGLGSSQTSVGVSIDFMDARFHKQRYFSKARGEHVL